MRSLLFVIAFLISYGSLYPFELEPRAIDPTLLLRLFSHFDAATSLSNIVANLLLFIPYGFVAKLALDNRDNNTLTLALYIVVGSILAVALQVAQIWIPGRMPTIGDAAINVVGIFFGILLATPFHRRMPATGQQAFDGLALAAGALALSWIIYRWFPVVPTIDFQNLKNAFKPLLLEPEIRPVRAFHDMVAWLAFFRLLAFTPLRHYGLSMLAAGAVLVILVTPFTVGNTISPHNLIGLGLAIAAMPLLNKHYASSVIVGGLFISLLLVGLMPYQLALQPNEFKWIPFSGFLGGSMATNLLNLFYKSFIYGAALFLLRDCGSRPVAAAVTVAVWLGMIEFAQIWIAGRTAEITDPILALLLAWALHRLVNSGQRHPFSHRRAGRPSPKITPKSSKDAP